MHGVGVALSHRRILINKCRSIDRNLKNHHYPNMTVTISAGSNYQWMLRLVGWNYVKKQDTCISLKVSPYKGENNLEAAKTRHHQS